ncbi:MAG: hypothetical protein ACE147_14205 [Candidatus Methylomirabilales bacterium]
MSRRLRPFPLEDLLLVQLPAGFLLAVGWSVMYEVYHDEGSYYTTLMQEILSTEGLFPYFLLSALLMAVPLGLLLDTLRHVLDERWLARAAAGGEKRPRDLALAWLVRWAADPGLAERYVFYRHLRATVLAPAQAAGNLAVVLAIFLVWFVVKVIRIQGWTVFSPAFIVGTPVIGVALIAALLARYAGGVREFQRLCHEGLGGRGARAAPAGPASPEAGTPAFPA